MRGPESGANDVVEHLTLPGHGGASASLELADALVDAHQIGAALQVEVATELRDAQRQLLLLPPLALLNQVADAGERLRIGLGGRRGLRLGRR